MSNPRTIPMLTREYKNLEAAAKMLEATSENGLSYKVEKCYFDFGLKWMWTTIICHDYMTDSFLDSWQAVNPAQWEAIVNAETVQDLCKAVEDVQSGESFKDR